MVELSEDQRDVLMGMPFSRLGTPAFEDALYRYQRFYRSSFSISWCLHFSQGEIYKTIGFTLEQAKQIEEAAVKFVSSTEFILECEHEIERKTKERSEQLKRQQEWREAQLEAEQRRRYDRLCKSVELAKMQAEQIAATERRQRNQRKAKLRKRQKEWALEIMEAMEVSAILECEIERKCA